MTQEEIDILIDLYRKQHKAFRGFLSNVTDYFKENEDLVDERGRSVVHSTKWRLKDVDHLGAKLKRKSEQGRNITPENLSSSVTDFCGARVMHLRRSDFMHIHNGILRNIADQHWYFAAEPKAYTWDPEYKAYFDSLGIRSEIK